MAAWPGIKRRVHGPDVYRALFAKLCVDAGAPFRASGVACFGGIYDMFFLDRVSFLHCITGLTSSQFCDTPRNEVEKVCCIEDCQAQMY